MTPTVIHVLGGGVIALRGDELLELTLTADNHKGTTLTLDVREAAQLSAVLRVWLDRHGSTPEEGTA